MLLYEERHLPDNIEPKNGRFILTIVDQGTNSAKYGEIHLGRSALNNQQLIKAKVKSFSGMAEGMGLDVDDIVLFDKYAAYYRPDMEVGNDIIIDLVNIICKIDDDEIIHPYGEYALVEAVENDKENVIERKHKYNRNIFNVIENGNIGTSPVNVGETILASLGGSVAVSQSEKKLKLIPYQCIMGKF